MSAPSKTAAKRANDMTDDECLSAVGYIACCLATVRAGYTLEGFPPEYGCIVAAPTQAEVDSARRMAGVIADPYWTRRSRS